MGAKGPESAGGARLLRARRSKSAGELEVSAIF